MDLFIGLSNILMLLLVTYITVVASKYTNKDTAGLPLVVMLVLDAAFTYIFYTLAVEFTDITLLKRGISISFMLATALRVLVFIKQLKPLYD